MKYMNITKTEADKYLQRTVELAKSAISESKVNRRVYIAGSIGPYADCPASVGFPKLKLLYNWLLIA